MSIATSLGIDRATAGEADLHEVPKRYQGDGAIRGLIYCHGAGETAASPIPPDASHKVLLRALAETYPIVAGDFSGDAWSNDTAMTRVGNARTWLQGDVGAESGKVFLLGVSMGGLTALNWAAANPTLVAAIVLVKSVIDINDIKVNNRGGLAAEVNAAYGGTYDNTTLRATKNPSYWITQGSPLSGIPIQTWYGELDSVAIPSIEATFAADAVGTTVDRHSLGAIDHAGTTPITASVVLAFLAENAG